MICPNCRKDELLQHPGGRPVYGCPKCISVFRKEELQVAEPETRPVIRLNLASKVIRFMSDGKETA